MTNKSSKENMKYSLDKIFFVRQYKEDGTITVVHCQAEKMDADIMTKMLPRKLFSKFCKFLFKGHDGIKLVDSRTLIM